MKLILAGFECQYSENKTSGLHVMCVVGFQVELCS